MPTILIITIKLITTSISIQMVMANKEWEKYLPSDDGLCEQIESCRKLDIRYKNRFAISDQKSNHDFLFFVSLRLKRLLLVGLSGGGLKVTFIAVEIWLCSDRRNLMWFCAGVEGWQKTAKYWNWVNTEGDLNFINGRSSRIMVYYVMFEKEISPRQVPNAHRSSH